jgi:hypothetical protein
MHENMRAALRAGYRRWLEQTWVMKDAGLISRFPNGRRKAGEILPGKRTTLLGPRLTFINQIDEGMKWRKRKTSCRPTPGSGPNSISPRS